MNWIKVSERLPEVDDNGQAFKLLLWDGKEIMFGMFQRDHDGSEQFVEYEYGSAGGVTHWCKPAPPALIR